MVCCCQVVCADVSLPYGMRRRRRASEFATTATNDSVLDRYHPPPLPRPTPPPPPDLTQGLFSFVLGRYRTTVMNTPGTHSGTEADGEWQDEPGTEMAPGTPV